MGARYRGRMQECLLQALAATLASASCLFVVCRGINYKSIVTHCNVPSMCRQCVPLCFQCGFENRAHWGTLQKAAQSPMCCKVQCVLMCLNAFQCVFFPMCFNVPSMCSNVFSMCFSHIENKWSRDSCRGAAIQVVFSSCEFN